MYVFTGCHIDTISIIPLQIAPSLSLGVSSSLPLVVLTAERRHMCRRHLTTPFLPAFFGKPPHFFLLDVKLFCSPANKILPVAGQKRKNQYNTLKTLGNMDIFTKNFPFNIFWPGTYMDLLCVIPLFLTVGFHLNWS